MTLPLGFLSGTEREAINKQIAHATLVGLEAVGYRWDVFELFSKGVRQAMHFFEWAEKEFGSDRFLTWTTALFGRHKLKAMFEYVAAEAQRHKAENQDVMS